MPRSVSELTLAQCVEIDGISEWYREVIASADDLRGVVEWLDRPQNRCDHEGEEGCRTCAVIQSLNELFDRIRWAH